MRYLSLLFLAFLFASCSREIDPTSNTAESGNLYVDVLVGRGVTRIPGDSSVFEIAAVEESLLPPDSMPLTLPMPATATVNGLGLSHDATRPGLVLRRWTLTDLPFLAPIGSMNTFVISPGEVAHGLHDSLPTPVLEDRLVGVEMWDTLHLDDEINIALASAAVIDSLNYHRANIQLSRYVPGSNDPGAELGLSMILLSINGLHTSVKVRDLLASPYTGPAWLSLRRQNSQDRTSATGKKYTATTIAYEDIPVVIAP